MIVSRQKQENNVVVWAAVLATSIGWLYLWDEVLGLSQSIDLADLGPGMGIVGNLLYRLNINNYGFGSICISNPQENGTIEEYVRHSIMWAAMTLAMMGPFIAKCKPESSAQVAGQITAWLLYCIVMGAIQQHLVANGLMSSGYILDRRPALIGILVLLSIAFVYRTVNDFIISKSAGLYAKANGQFLSGIISGFRKIGYCFPLMATMLVAGTMNLVVMTALIFLSYALSHRIQYYTSVFTALMLLLH